MRRIVCVLAMSAACAHFGPDRTPTDSDVALDVAGELEHQHRYAIARAQLAAIADVVGAAEAEELRLRACRTFGLEGDSHAERACYAEAVSPRAQSNDRDDVATAREQEAKAARALLTNDSEAERFIVAFADTEAAHKALVALLEDQREHGGCPAQLALLERLEDAIADTIGNVLDAEVAVRRAELLYDGCRDDAKVVDAAERAEKLAQKTHWLDDAQWILGRAAERIGQLDQALAAYSRIVDSRSDAWVFGSNDSIFLDEAWLAKGLLLERMGRTNEARDTLRDLIKARDTSRLRDDAERALARIGSRASRGGSSSDARYSGRARD